MRSNQKKALVELTDTLAEAHTQIEIQLDSNNSNAAITLLSQCQECAISMGTSIENSEGKGFITVHHLEKYCETAYSIAEEISQDKALSANKTGKILQKSLNNIKNSIQNDIPIKKEIVFLPYNASMWDSLESVWRKSCKDSTCDTYVIPIPYFDKNPNGTVKEEHYDGDSFPSDVPITDYRQYDFAAHHPDKIYIHNPYDGNNFVTSVHPFFYSDNIKQYTDELIYIPYFVLGEPTPDNLDLYAENIAHFILTPGVFNADKVIVQSEMMRKAYIKTLVKNTGVQTQAYWENKISGEGSPKFEKVLNTRIDDLDIPDEWMSILNKPDGTRKKIILYNTSIQAMLDNTDKMIEKIKNALKIFKENSNEIALLWRPHPLLKATISSMLPSLWTEYEKIISQYIREGWGIYDDTSDLDRAIILSDAYYGDNSSLVPLYKKTKKPIMIQNADVLDSPTT
ncbi:MAG: hypothetical protein K6G03_08300 [Lachnospiraceae bacterium]|nr:hypothetical protein [Lachnospiraceae bacterium]